MRFASPIWLWGLAAVALPIAIHLLSRGQRVRVRVGSVRLIESAPGRRGRRPRWSELVLLAARAALLAAVALVLAGPIWSGRTVAPSAATGWILFAPEALADGAAAARFEELRSQGHQPRRLAAGLPVASPDAARSAPIGADADSDLWSLLREAHALAPPGAPFFVFAAPRFEGLRGLRPAFARPVRWDSGPAPPAAPAPPSRPAVRGNAQAPVTVTLDVASARATERSYVRAGLEALRAEGDVGLVLAPPAVAPGSAAETASDRSAERSAADLLIWLHSEPIPAVLFDRVRAGAILIAALDGELAPCTDELVARAGGVDHRVALRRCPDAAAPDPQGAPVWRDGRGRARLAVEALAGEAGGRGGLVYRYAGRFDADDSDLVLSPAFPEFLRDVVRLARRRAAATSGALFDATDPQWLAAHTGALASRTQAAPRELGVPPVRAAQAPAEGSGEGAGGRWGWLAVALLFAFERILVLRSPA